MILRTSIAPFATSDTPARAHAKAHISPMTAMSAPQNGCKKVMLNVTGGSSTAASSIPCTSAR
jgi:hypothetical protein